MTKLLFAQLGSPPLGWLIGAKVARRAMPQ